MAKYHSESRAKQKAENQEKILEGLSEFSKSTSTMETFYRNEILPLFNELGIKVKK
ncbi:MAG: hypothetical protein WAV23_03320 [Minisyncoccia bacterium]